MLPSQILIECSSILIEIQFAVSPSSLGELGRLVVESARFFLGGGCPFYKASSGFLRAPI